MFKVMGEGVRDVNDDQGDWRGASNGQGVGGVSHVQGDGRGGWGVSHVKGDGRVVTHVHGDGRGVSHVHGDGRGA